MKDTLAKVGRWAAIAALIVGYPVLAHYSPTTSAATQIPALGVAVSLAPSLAILLWLAWCSAHRAVVYLLCLALGELLWAFWPALEANFNWVYFIQHAGTNALLAMAFGITPGRGRRPLVTRLAESVRGTLSPAILRYTRQVTLAWALFFAAIGTLSVLLFFLAPIKIWSLFANFLTLPLAATMFTAEYLVRLRKVPDEKHYRFIDGMRAYWKRPGSTAESTSPGR